MKIQFNYCLFQLSRWRTINKRKSWIKQKHVVPELTAGGGDEGQEEQEDEEQEYE